MLSRLLAYLKHISYGQTGKVEEKNLYFLSKVEKGDSIDGKLLNPQTVSIVRSFPSPILPCQIILCCDETFAVNLSCSILTSRIAASVG